MDAGGDSVKLQFAERTVVGNVRPSNQDAVLATRGAEPETWVFAVADGVGGLVDGAEASSSAIAALQAAAAGGGGPLAPRLEARLIECNSEVFNRGAATGRASATTIVVLCIERGQFSVLHAGDSRAYVLREGRILPLTEDHSWVADQVRSGALAAEDAATSPYRNVITRAVGVEPSLSLERSAGEPCKAGDCYLLCSDGLHGLVPDAGIAGAVAAGGDPDAIADRLVALANASGGTDNISVVVAIVGD
jgi:serine/threonine protein phosphatase PrpC